MMDAQTILDRMVEKYGDRIVDPDVFPRVFNYQVMMTKWEIQNEQKAAQSSAEA